MYSTAAKSVKRPTDFPIQWELGAPYPRIKRRGQEAVYSPSSSAEVKNGKTILPVPHLSSWLLA
jgi:hypothetical protein